MSGLREHAFEVKWCIENIKSWLQTRDDTLYSPQFLPPTLTNTCWKLSLSTNWQLAEKYLSFTLQRDVEDNGPELITLNYELSFLASDGSSLKSKFYTKKFASKTVSHELNVKEIEILEEKKEAYVPENVLMLRCKVWKAWSKVSKGGQCSIRSVIGTKRITLDGAVNNFNTLDRSATVNFMSPSSEISFISFNACKQGDNMKFERQKVECKCFSSYSCKLFVLDARRQKNVVCTSSKLETLLTSYNPCSFESNYSWNDLKRIRYLQNGTLKFQLEITYYPGIESECIEYLDSENSDDPSLLEYKKEFKRLSNILETKSSDEDEGFNTAVERHLPSTTLNSDLISLYNDHLFCDTKLLADSETFPAHRCVLSARSPVFKKMFATDMKEAAGECINVPDFTSDTVSRMLQFLYTDCIGDLEMQSAKDLYTISDKYDIASLKQQCSSFMKKSLCPSNVSEVLVLADIHQDKDLEFTAHEFVLKYGKEVLGSEEWKLFMKNYSSLAAQVMYLICMKE